MTRLLSSSQKNELFDNASSIDFLKSGVGVMSAAKKEIVSYRA